MQFQAIARKENDSETTGTHTPDSQPAAVEHTQAGIPAFLLARFGIAQSAAADQPPGVPNSHTGPHDTAAAALRRYLQNNPTGQPVDPEMRAPVEHHANQSLGHARLHNNQWARAITRAYGASALTVGRHILLDNQLTPQRARPIVAHELGHVAQSAGQETNLGLPFFLGAHSSPAEHNASALADHTAQPMTVGANTVQRYPDTATDPPWVKAQSERMLREAQIERAKHDRWVKSHQKQFTGALASQPQSLEEDIQGTELLIMQMRGAMFKEIGKNSSLPPDLMEKWGSARQAVDVIKSLADVSGPPAPDVKARDSAPPTGIAQPPSSEETARGAFSAFYWALMKAMLADEQRDKEMEQFSRAFETSNQPQQTYCPGNCHAPTGPSGPSQFGFKFKAPPPTSPYVKQVMKRLEEAKDQKDWQGVLRDFNWATEKVDKMLLARLPQKSQARTNFEYAQGLLERQRAVQETDPSAVRIPAMFYPKDDFTENGEQAKGIPWQFYLTHTGTKDPFATARAGISWTLMDITSPGKPKVNQESTSPFDAVRLQKGARVDPPPALFKQLNDKLRFPEGQLYWTMPRGQNWQLETTARWSLSDWLRAIGIGVAALGIILASAGYGTPAAVALVGSALISVGATAADLQERKEAGVLTQQDIDRATLSIALDLASAMSLGLGRIASVSAKAASSGAAVSRLGGLAGRLWFPATGLATGLEAANLCVATSDFVQQYRAIKGNDQLSEADKDRALSRLVLTGLVTGGLTILSLRGNMKDLAGGATLHVDVDVDGAPRIRDANIPDSTGIPVEGNASIKPRGVGPPAPGEAINVPRETIPDKYKDMSVKELRKRLRADPEAAEALRLKYRAMPDTKLMRYRDEIAMSVMESRVGFDMERQMAGHGPFSRKESYGELLDSLTEARTGAPTDRVAKSILTPDVKKTTGGTIGAANTDVPTLENRRFIGKSPEARSPGDPVYSRPDSPFAPQTDPVKLPQTHGHAEQELAEQLDAALSTVPIDQRRGKTVWMLIEAEPCSACAQGVRKPNEAPGVLRSLSEKYPEMTFEVKNLESSARYRLKGGADQ